MATYLEGVEDGRRDILVRIEREAVASFRDGLAVSWQAPYGQNLRTKVSVLVNLIHDLSPEPVSWITIHSRVEDEALRQDEAQRNEARVLAAKQVGS